LGHRAGVFLIPGFVKAINTSPELWLVLALVYAMDHRTSQGKYFHLPSGV
jgi:hypothetical protein